MARDPANPANPAWASEPLTPLELVLAAASEGVLFTRDGRWSAPWTAEAETITALERERAMVSAIVAGTRTRHRWAPCSVCGQACMVKLGTKPRCRFTPGCKGFHVRQSLPRGLVT